MIYLSFFTKILIKNLHIKEDKRFLKTEEMLDSAPFIMLSDSSVSTRNDSFFLTLYQEIFLPGSARFII